MVVEGILGVGKVGIERKGWGMEEGLGGVEIGEKVGVE